MIWLVVALGFLLAACIGLLLNTATVGAELRMLREENELYRDVTDELTDELVQSSKLVRSQADTIRALTQVSNELLGAIVGAQVD